jgi:hypothetical protein
MEMFGISKKSRRKEVDSALTPSLPRHMPTQGEKNSLPPSNAWNYSSRSSSISNDDSHRSSFSSTRRKVFPYFLINMI